MPINVPNTYINHTITVFEKAWRMEDLINWILIIFNLYNYIKIQYNLIML